MQEDCIRIFEDEGVVNDFFNDDVDICSMEHVKEKIGCNDIWSD